MNSPGRRARCRRRGPRALPLRARGAAGLRDRDSPDRRALRRGVDQPHPRLRYGVSVGRVRFGDFCTSSMKFSFCGGSTCVFRYDVTPNFMISYEFPQNPISDFLQISRDLDSF